MIKDEQKISHAQNFLKNSKFVSSLIDKTDIGTSDLVVEIGPGKGIITKELAKRAGQVIAIEKDPKLADDLSSTFNQIPNVKIIKADFLQWRLPDKPYKIFSNIPFNLTTDIILKLLNNKNPPKAAFLIMQDKAAERFIGEPLVKNTQASILLKPWFDMAIIIPINKREFTPVPNVNIVLAMFKKREIPIVKPPLDQYYRDFVIYGYNQWEPTILEAFKSVFSLKQKSILIKENNLEKVKPSAVSFEQWLRLFDVFIKYVPEKKKALVRGAEEKLKEQQQKLKKLHRTR